VTRSAAPTDIATGIAGVRARIAAAAARVGRAASAVHLIGISKTVPADRVQEAVDAGLTDLGENRIQEASGKIPEIHPGDDELTWHLVGRLQKNKVRRALELFTWIHSVDSAPLAERIDRIAGEMGLTPTVLLEVNLAGEATKSGIPHTRLGELLEMSEELRNVHVAGLMAVPPAPPAGSGPEASRPWFKQLAGLRDTWSRRGYDLPVLSMGMTGDFDIAVEEGATHVRVGRAIFGKRPPARKVAG
jgi:hypothetical protein